jgi:hypothetical protein
MAGGKVVRVVVLWMSDDLHGYEMWDTRDTAFLGCGTWIVWVLLLTAGRGLFNRQEDT